MVSVEDTPLLVSMLTKDAGRTNLIYFTALSWIGRISAVAVMKPTSFYITS
jgi:hypothetical protein